MSQMGHERLGGTSNSHIRYAPLATVGLKKAACREGPMRDIPCPHSITSSASCWSCVGISRPSAVAVLRLITRSNLSGRCVGNSLGLAPCRIFPT